MLSNSEKSDWQERRFINEQTGDCYSNKRLSTAQVAIALSDVITELVTLASDFSTTGTTTSISGWF